MPESLMPQYAMGWLLLALFIITIIIFLANLILQQVLKDEREYDTTLPRSKELAIKQVEQLCGRPWLVADTKIYFQKKGFIQINLGKILEIKHPGEESLSLYFPKDHPDEKNILNYCVGESVVFIKTNVEIQDSQVNNPTSYIRVRLE
jgi:hypothetical protein